MLAKVPSWVSRKETPALSLALSVILSAVLMPRVLMAMVDYSVVPFP